MSAAPALADAHHGVHLTSPTESWRRGHADTLCGPIRRRLRRSSPAPDGLTLSLEFDCRLGRPGVPLQHRPSTVQLPAGAARRGKLVGRVVLHLQAHGDRRNRTVQSRQPPGSSAPPSRALALFAEQASSASWRPLTPGRSRAGHPRRGSSDPAGCGRAPSCVVLRRSCGLPCHPRRRHPSRRICRRPLSRSSLPHVLHAFPRVSTGVTGPCKRVDSRKARRCRVRPTSETPRGPEYSSSPGSRGSD